MAGGTPSAAAAIRALADLTPSAERKDEALAVPLEWFRWTERGTSLFETDILPDRAEDIPSIALDSEFGERLAAVQQVRAGTLRIGWLWVAGTATVVTSSGAQVRRRVFHPLATRPVRVVRSGFIGGWMLRPAGDREVTSLIADRHTARSLEETIECGGGAIDAFSDLWPELLQRLPKLATWARSAAAAAGLPATALINDRDEPTTLMRHEGLRIVAGIAVFSTDSENRTTRAGSLRGWLDDLHEPTAFHAVYAGADTSIEPPSAQVETPLPVTPRQREVVQHSRTRPLTVVSGAPGTGKSHTLVAIVCDALRRGESVLVTSKTDAAVDALITLLERQPGINPVVFGADERRAALARRLANGELSPATDDEVEAAARRLFEASAARDSARRAVEASLTPDWLATPTGQAQLEPARELAPRAFTARIDLAPIERLVALTPPRGWWSRRRRGKDEQAARVQLGAADSTPLVEALAAARLATARFPTALGSPAPAALCHELEAAEARVRTALTAWLAVETRSHRRFARSGLAAVAALATALRSGRSARRAQLERLRDRTLTMALPVWMGTLGDVDDLLPPVPALFDLVLIDEASAIEQTLAASSLLRGRRAVIVGDPQQLRHVSFVADATISSVLDAEQVREPAARAQLDVRRNSVFDAAAAAAPVLMLDEHFRSVPHLIQTVAHTLYDGRLHVATRTPLTEQRDCVFLERLVGRRAEGGIMPGEITSIVSQLAHLAAVRATSVGVITPFRAQADAIEKAVLASFTADQLISMDLRVSTVHGFQGNERDIVLCSLGLADDDSSGWSFVNDEHLLAVMLTRARLQMHLYVSCAPALGVLGQYVANADSPPGTPQPRGTLAPWAARVVGELRSAGVSLAECYPTGRHVIDAVTAVHNRPVAIVCTMHADGVDAHVERHLALLRSGWTVIDALEGRWGDHLAELVVDLAGQLRPT